MNIASLPKYPRSQAPREKSGSMMSPRAARILLDLVLLTAIAAMFFVLRRAPLSFERPLPPPPQASFDFELIQRRYEKVLYLHYSKVVELLGPPSPWSREPEFARTEAHVAARPDRYPGGPFLWEKWTDPKNKDRWVAVFFANGIAYDVLKKGF